MKKIFKYEIPFHNKFEMELPKGALILDAQFQHGFPQLWALIDSDAPLEWIRFVMYGTGHPVDESILGAHIATMQQNNGQFIWHLFYRREE